MSKRRSKPQSNQGCPQRKRATCRTRLRGWLSRVAKRAEIWGDVDLSAFCRMTGYSREHATRELSRIRAEEPELFTFETKQRRKGKKRRKRWGVIVAVPEKLKFDRHSLFFGEDGTYLHNYTNLGISGFKISPTVPGVLDLDRNFCKLLPERTNQPDVCDISLPGEGCGATQPLNSNGAVRLNSAGAGSRCSAPGAGIPDALKRLKGKAFYLVDELKKLHWDNCKVQFNSLIAFRFAFEALRNGHSQKRILFCYEKSLVVCHGLAVDHAARTGQICCFALSSTVSKARRMLAADGLDRRRRMERWYRTSQKSSETDQTIESRKSSDAIANRFFAESQSAKALLKTMEASKPNAAEEERIRRDGIQQLRSLLDRLKSELNQEDTQ